MQARINPKNEITLSAVYAGDVEPFTPEWRDVAKEHEAAVKDNHLLEIREGPKAKRPEEGKSE